MNYYEILKIQKNASKQQIKSSYKALVKQYHPDLYRGDKEFAEHKIKEINEAYAILSNPEKKAEYDEFLTPTVTSNLYYTTYEPHSPSPDPTNPPPDREQKWTFSKWLAEKFNKLDRKKQLQAFILIIILFLALFLINLIEVKYYLNSNNTNSSTNTLNTTNTVEKYDDTDFTNIPFAPPDIYEENDLKTLDDLLYDLLQTYENTTFSDSQNTIFELENSY